MSKSLHNNQQGLVSITVTIVIMIVITLIVGSFALIVRREQRRSLDSQLSTQAFYAAEAGVTDAYKALVEKKITDDIDECTGSGSFLNKMSNHIPSININNQFDDGTGVGYSCVLIKRDVDNWISSSSSPQDGAFIVPLTTNTPISKLRISWQQKDGNASFTTNFNRPQAGLDVPMLKVTLFNTDSLTRDGMKNSSHTMFLAPVGNGSPNVTGNIGYLDGSDPNRESDSRQGAMVSGNCNSASAPHHCNVEINGLNGTGTNYYLVVQPLYQAAAIDISGLDASGAPVTLKDSQAEIDVTGKAADVLRRIKVRVPIRGGSTTGSFSGIFPDAAISTTESICKQWTYTTPTVAPVDHCPPPPPDEVGGTPTGGSSNDGTAVIGTWPPAPPSGNAPAFNFQFTFPNHSQNEMDLVTGCTWDFGDSTIKSDGIVWLPPNKCRYKDNISHTYIDTSSEIISSNGNKGCRRYTVTLTMHFTPESGVPDKTDTTSAFVPRGQANDPGGICSKTYRSFP